MNKLTLCLAILLSSTCIANAQTVPAKVTALLNKSHKGWKPAPGFCEGKKWSLTGDFDGNGRKDYLVRIKTGTSAKTMTLDLIAFRASADGSYKSESVLSDEFTGEMLRSSFALVKKGTTVPLGEGEGGSIILKTDAVTQFICETDANKTMVYENGKWRNIYED